MRNLPLGEARLRQDRTGRLVERQVAGQADLDHVTGEVATPEARMDGQRRLPALVANLIAFAVLSGCATSNRAPLEPPLTAWFHQTPSATRQIIGSWCAETDPWYLLSQTDQQIACLGDHPPHTERSTILGGILVEIDHFIVTEWVTFTLTPEGAGTCVTAVPEVRRIGLYDDGQYSYEDRHPRSFNDLYPVDGEHDDQDFDPRSGTDLIAVIAELGASISAEHRDLCRPMPQ